MFEQEEYLRTEEMVGIRRAFAQQNQYLVDFRLFERDECRQMPGTSARNA